MWVRQGGEAPLEESGHLLAPCYMPGPQNSGCGPRSGAGAPTQGGAVGWKSPQTHEGPVTPSRWVCPPSRWCDGGTRLPALPPSPGCPCSHRAAAPSTYKTDASPASGHKGAHVLWPAQESDHGDAELLQDLGQRLRCPGGPSPWPGTGCRGAAAGSAGGAGPLQPGG